MSQKQSEQLPGESHDPAEYEPPCLTYCGNLHDLLADNITSPFCDSITSGGAGSGHDSCG
jgi:hypothetical protein